MDKDSLPRWAWLLAALLVTAFVAQLINAIAGVSPDWQVVMVVSLMAPVLIYVGIWYNEDRQHYWEHSRGKIGGDIVFIIVGTGLGAGIGVAATIDFIGTQIIRDVLAMGTGFVFGWSLFWWRNTELYGSDDTQR